MKDAVKILTGIGGQAKETMVSGVEFRGKNYPRRTGADFNPEFLESWKDDSKIARRFITGKAYKISL